MMHFKIGMYDWNGTVANDPQICHACVIEIFKAFGPDLPIPSFEEWRTEHGGHNFLEFYYERGISREKMSIEQLRNIWTAYYGPLTLANDHAIIREGVEDVLMHCFKAATPNIVVSSSIDAVEYYLTLAEVRHLFDCVHVGVPHKRETLRAVMRQYDVGVGQGFYIDDTFDGITYANEVGLVTFGLISGCQDEARIRAAKPDYPVHSFAEVFEILRT